jgi:hypothetical protein
MVQIQPEPPGLAGITIHRAVIERVGTLVDEYGDACAAGDARAERRRGLHDLLRAICRTLRLEAVSGDRYQLIRQGDAVAVSERSDVAPGLHPDSGLRFARGVPGFVVERPDRAARGLRPAAS